MNVFKDSDALQKFLQLNFQAFRCVVTIGLAVLFIMAFILTSPLFRLGVYLSDLCRLNSTSSNQINKGKL
jgi:hypothetical protein